MSRCSTEPLYLSFYLRSSRRERSYFTFVSDLVTVILSAPLKTYWLCCGVQPVCETSTLFFLEFQASPCFIRSSFIDQACGHIGYIELNLFPSMKLRSNRHTAVVHHKLSGFAGIELQEIVLSTIRQSSLSVQCFSLLLLQTACFSLGSIHWHHI